MNEIKLTVDFGTAKYDIGIDDIVKMFIHAITTPEFGKIHFGMDTKF